MIGALTAYALPLCPSYRDKSKEGILNRRADSSFGNISHERQTARPTQCGSRPKSKSKKKSR